MGRHRPDRGAGLAGIVALGVACSPPASLRRQLDRADDMQPILEAQGTPALLELYDHCDARDHEPWLVCRATTEELGRRAKARLDAQHRGYADRFDWASFGGWALRGTCDDARAAVEQAGALWQGLDHPEALGLDRARVAEQFRPHLASSLGYALEYTGAHADALVACGDGDGLAQLLEHFAATTVPRWVEVFAAADPSILGTDAVLDDLAERWPRLARRAAAHSSSPRLEPLRRGDAPEPCPTERGALEAMLLSPRATERSEACECVALRSYDGRDGDRDDLVVLREQLAAYDFWSGEPLHDEPLLQAVASYDPPSPSGGGGHEGPRVPDGAGPLVTGLAGGAMVLGGALRVLGGGGGSRAPATQYEVRRQCTALPLDPSRPTRPASRVRIVGVDEAMQALRVVTLVPGGASWRSKVVVWSVDEAGHADGGYCRDSQPDAPHAALPRCPAQRKSFLVEPLDGHGEHSDAEASTVVDLRTFDVPRARVVVGVLDDQGAVTVSDPVAVSELPVRPQP